VEPQLPEGVGAVVGVDNKLEGFPELEAVRRTEGTVDAAGIEAAEAEEVVVDRSVKRISGAYCLVILD